MINYWVIVLILEITFTISNSMIYVKQEKIPFLTILTQDCDLQLHHEKQKVANECKATQSPLKHETAGLKNQ